MCAQFVLRSAPWWNGESTTGPKKKLQNTSTTHRHERTRPPTRPQTDINTNRLTDLPTHDVLQQYCSTCSRACVGTCRVYPCAVLRFPFFNDSPRPRGASDPSSEGRLFKAPARRVGYRRPFFRRGHRWLLRGAGVEPLRGCERPSGARESQLIFGYVTTKIFSKIHLDITTTTEQHYICLLYTSPSPRDGLLSRMPSSA